MSTTSAPLLLVLPGMDGSGLLHDAFIAAMQPRFPTRVVAYPSDKVLDYHGLQEWLRPQLPTGGNWVLLGESFSGPLAIRVAAEQPSGLSGLVLCASFVSSPQPWFASMHGALRLPLPMLPARALMPLMMGRWTTAEWTAREQQALDRLHPAVARARLQQVLRADEREALCRVRCPVLYLQASHDRLVPPHNWQLISRLAADATCKRLRGPHFLLQAVPEDAAAAVCDFIAVTPSMETPQHPPPGPT